MSVDGHEQFGSLRAFHEDFLAAEVIKPYHLPFVESAHQDAILLVGECDALPFHLLVGSQVCPHAIDVSGYALLMDCCPKPTPDRCPSQRQN